MLLAGLTLLAAASVAWSPPSSANGVGTITTVAGTGSAPFNGDGQPATSANVVPDGVVLAPNGDLYVADGFNHRVRRVDAVTQTVTTVAGTGIGGYTGDGGPAVAAQLRTPTQLALDFAGNLYISDTQDARVRRVDAATHVISTVVGNGSPTYAGDDGSPAASAGLEPAGIVVDAAGNLFVADGIHNRVRRIDAPTQTIWTYAGTGSTFFAPLGDGGPATAATVRQPWGLALDARSNLVIAEFGGNRIRRVDAVTHVITTVAEAATPRDVALDAAGNTFFGSYYEDTVGRIDAATQAITTVAGTGDPVFNGDDQPATSASLANPNGLAIDAAGNLLIGDTDHSRVRRVAGIAAVPPPNQAPVAAVYGGLHATMNPSSRPRVHASDVATDPDADTLRFVPAAGSTGVGTWMCGEYDAGADGCWFAPFAYATGATSFPATVTDGHGGAVTVTIAVTVSAIACSTTAEACALAWASPGDLPAPADYNEDGRTDLAVFRPTTGTWYVRNIWDSGFVFASPGDLPSPGDYNGDGRTDFAVFRPATGTWYADTDRTGFGAGVGNLVYRFGSPGDLACAADFDGDGVTDLCVFRPPTGTWYVDTNRDGVADRVIGYASPGDLPAPGHYPGTVGVEPAVFRPATGRWYVRGTWNAGRRFASSGDLPAPGDYDADTTLDVAVFRPASATWYVRNDTWPWP